MKNVTECKHEFKRTKMTRTPQKDGSVILAHCEVRNDYCPDCGKKLNQTNESGDLK